MEKERSVWLEGIHLGRTAFSLAGHAKFWGGPERNRMEGQIQTVLRPFCLKETEEDAYRKKIPPPELVKEDIGRRDELRDACILKFKKWMNWWMVDRWTIIRWTNQWMDGWIYRWMDRGMDKWMDGGTNERIDGWMDLSSCLNFLNARGILQT